MSRLHIRTRVVAAALCGMAVFAASSAARAVEPLPVNYDFLAGATATAMTPGLDPPGANDWNCKPSSEHPIPIVLVHGLLGNKADNWQMFAPLLKNNGYCVFALTYGASPYEPAPYNAQAGGLTYMEDSAVQLQAFVAKVLAATGVAKVDILGHSEGTIVPDYYAKFLGGAKYIDQYISIAPIWHGTNVAGLSTAYGIAQALGFGSTTDSLLAATSFQSGSEMLSSSAFIAKLRSGGTPAVAGIKYTNIVTRYDELVVPYTSGIQAGMTNYTIQDLCPTDFSDHLEIAASPTTAQLVLNTLDPTSARPVPCHVVLPALGPPPPTVSSR